MTPSLQLTDPRTTDVLEAIHRASRSLLDRQFSEGYWWADLTADSTLESDYIWMELWLHPPVDGEWTPPRQDRIDKAANAILARQLPDGGFSIYPHGPSDVSASTKAYFALKLAGLAAEDTRMI